MSTFRAVSNAVVGPATRNRVAAGAWTWTSVPRTRGFARHWERARTRQEATGAFAQEVTQLTRMERLVTTRTSASWMAPSATWVAKTYQAVTDVLAQRGNLPIITGTIALTTTSVPPTHLFAVQPIVPIRWEVTLATAKRD